MDAKPPMDKATLIVVCAVIGVFVVGFIVAGFVDGQPEVGFAVSVPLLAALHSTWVLYRTDKDAPAR